MAKITSIQLFKNIKTLVEQSKLELYVIANATLTETYFHIGRSIVEYGQQGSNRSGYSKEVLINLSAKLTTELGKGFLFVDRQKRIKMDGDDYKIDLVFYHRILKCFVLIDLKIGTLKHQDLGQLQMYVNYYDEEIKTAEENKNIGIILCKHKQESTIKYTLGKGNKQIFASKYKMYFPEKEILKLISEQ